MLLTKKKESNWGYKKKCLLGPEKQQCPWALNLHAAVARMATAAAWRDNHILRRPSMASTRSPCQILKMQGEQKQQVSADEDHLLKRLHKNPVCSDIGAGNSGNKDVVHLLFGPGPMC